MTARRTFMLGLALVVMAGSHLASADPIYADYASALREATPRADGKLHVDSPALVARLVELHATTYAFLILQPTDFSDLTEFLPAAEAAGIDVWAYLVPPSEVPASYPPCAKDYDCWGTQLGALAAAHPHLTAIAMDDFIQNPTTITRASMGSMMAHARVMAPNIQLYAIAYRGGPLPTAVPELQQWFARDFQGVVNGVMFPFRELDSNAALPDQLEEVCSLWKQPGEKLGFFVPRNTPSAAGDYIAMTTTASTSGAQQSITFREYDSFKGSTSGYQFLQLRVGGALVWQADVAGGDIAFRDHTIDITAAVAGRSSTTIEFRLHDAKAIANFELDARVSQITGSGVELAHPAWTVVRNNTPTWIAGARSYEGKCVLMVYATSTSWHHTIPTTAIITEALTIGHEATVLGHADGTITYVLNKRATSPDFGPVAALYGAWTASSPSNPDAGVNVSGDAGTTPPHDGGCATDGHTGGGFGGLLAIALIAINAGAGGRKRRDVRGASARTTCRFTAPHDARGAVPCSSIIAPSCSAVQPSSSSSWSDCNDPPARTSRHRSTTTSAMSSRS